MKDVFRSIVMAFSMFSKIPMPRIEWKDTNMRFSLAALPLAGAVIGLILWGWHALCGVIGLGNTVHAAGLTLIPLAVTGGIHLDGYLDAMDALSSHGGAEKKRAILKDPHAGAFAVIWGAAYLLLYFALTAEIRDTDGVFMLGLAHILSRALTAFCALIFPASASEGLLSVFKGSADRIASAVTAAVIFAACTFLAAWFFGLSGAACPAAAALCAIYVYFMSKRQFGGMSGDLSGFLLQISELAMLFVYILASKILAAS